MKLFFGYLLIGLGILMPILLFTPIAKNEIQYQVRQISSRGQVNEVTPVNEDFALVIPKLAINAFVVKDVNPFDEKIYQKALTQGVAHAKGSALPGQTGNTFIFSHSSQNFFEAQKYNSIFYLLGKLSQGDEINIYYEKIKYSYIVTDIKIVDPKYISFMKAFGDSKILTLMTCYPPGTNFKRLIVKAKIL